jgi:hypothetical protein
MTHKKSLNKSLNKMLKKSLRKSIQKYRKSRKPCVYGMNQYGCCNKKPSIRKTKRCLEASKRRSSPCKYGEDENGCCNKRPTVKYIKSCRKSRKIRKSIESRIKLEKMLNDKHLIKKIIKSLTKSKRKSRKPQYVNRPSMQANAGLGKSQASTGHWSPFKKIKEIINKSIERKREKRKREEYKKLFTEIVNIYKKYIVRSSPYNIQTRKKQENIREKNNIKRKMDRMINRYKRLVNKIVEIHKKGLKTLTKHSDKINLNIISEQLVNLNTNTLLNIDINTLLYIDKITEENFSKEVIRNINSQNLDFLTKLTNSLKNKPQELLESLDLIVKLNFVNLIVPNYEVNIEHLKEIIDMIIQKNNSFVLDIIGIYNTNDDIQNRIISIIPTLKEQYITFCTNNKINYDIFK